MRAVCTERRAVDWRPELISKYDVAGPRYTSYPTAVQFEDGFRGAEYARYLKDKPTSVEPLSVYIHLPFCHNICYYCGCNKVVTRRPGVASEYLNYLGREVELVSGLLGRRRQVSQLHLGGGTPTYLSDAELTRLMHQLATCFQLVDDDSREYSIEIDPRTLGKNTLALLRGLGFNRASLGVQDFDPRVQKAVNREQPFEQVREQTELIRHLGYASLSFDLIYGLPYQSPQSIERTLDQVISLQPDRISCYNYAHLPERFPSQRSIDRLTLPSAADKLTMLGTIVQQLCDAGYIYLGMDHFVRPEDELARCLEDGRLQRNFRGYSTRLAKHLLALGVSGISDMGDCYVQNTRDLDDYYSALDKGELPARKSLRLSEEDQLRREVIMSLLCQMRLDRRAIEERHQLDFSRHFADELQQLESMQSEGLVRVDAEAIEITPAGRMLARNVCMIFDQYMRSAQQKFSRTI